MLAASISYSTKTFHFSSFPGVISSEVLIDKLGGLSILDTSLDRLFLNFACK